MFDETGGMTHVGFKSPSLGPALLLAPQPMVSSTKQEMSHSAPAVTTIWDTHEFGYVIIHSPAIKWVDSGECWDD